MKLETTARTNVTATAMAEALTTAKPDEFAHIWLEFNSLLERGDGTGWLDKCAKAMSNDIGSNCQKPLRKLIELIDYHRIAAKRDGDHDA